MYKTIERINEEFNEQWVFMINCEKDDNGTVMGGEVVLYSESRDKVIRGMNDYIMEESDTYLRYAGGEVVINLPILIKTTLNEEEES